MVYTKSRKIEPNTPRKNIGEDMPLPELMRVTESQFGVAQELRHREQASRVSA